MWEKVKLKNLLSKEGIFIDGDWIESKDQDQNGEIRLIQLADIGVGSFIDRSSRFMTKGKSVDLKCTYLKKDDILIARMPDPIGRCCVFPFAEDNKYVTVVDIAILRPNNKNVSIRFLQHYINSEDFRLKIAPNITGTTRQRISRGKLENLEIPLPPLPIQEKIATILDKADELRRKDKDLQAKYDELSQAIFIDMFGDPVKNEKGWQLRNGINVLSVFGGNAFKSSSYVNAGIPLLRIGSVNKGYYDKSQQVYISENSNFDKYKIYPNDLLVTLTGTVGKDDYGNICMIGHDFPFYYLNQRVAKIITDLNKTYLMYLLKQKEIKKELIGVSRGVRQANIGNNDFYKLNLPVPPITLQEAFAKKIELINQLKAQINAEKSEELFQSLLKKAFKGELVS